MTVLIILILLGVVLFIGISRPSWEAEKEEEIFTLEEGKGVFEVGVKLEDKKMINSPFLFTGYAFMSGEFRNLEAGKYKLNSEMSLRDMVNLFAKGDVVTQEITILEGWTIQEITRFLEEEGFNREDILSITGISQPQSNLLEVEARSSNLEGDFSILQDKPDNASLEGYLYPDTYSISDMDTENLIYRMVSNLEKKVSNNYPELLENEQNIHEIIILASLLEKEASDLEERRMISDILWRRKQAGIPLQVCASVNYVTGRNDTNVALEETEIDSPYNTYEIDGLPKGPIANPSLASIKAALNPKKNNYWYYLSVPGEDETIFSRNHLEHIKMKNKYLQ